MNKSVKLSNVLIIVIVAVTFTAVFMLNLQFALGTKTVINTSELSFLTHSDKDEELFLNDKKMLQLIAYIRNNYYMDTDDVNFKTGIYKGIFESLGDPYSVYMDTEEFEKFNETSDGSFGGIGIVVEPGKDNLITIVSPIEDTPGEAAGLKSGDKVVRVDGEDVYAETMDEAIKKMKGEPGSDVVLTIYRQGENLFDVNITRDMIVVKAVKSRVIVSAKNLGYIRITSFDSKVYNEFVSQYKTLKEQNIDGLILDLRNNPGGHLDQCVKLADYVLGKQLIVYTKNRLGEEKRYTSNAAKIDLPIAVLVNSGSASASEILTGAIKDSRSGTIIGTRTFGKGLVQNIWALSDGSGLKLTTSQYFTPNGDYIHGIGIAPDIIIEQSKNYVQGDDSTDEQLKKAIEVLTK